MLRGRTGPMMRAIASTPAVLPWTGRTTSTAATQGGPRTEIIAMLNYTWTIPAFCMGQNYTDSLAYNSR